MTRKGDPCYDFGDLFGEVLPVRPDALSGDTLPARADCLIPAMLLLRMLFG